MRVFQVINSFGFESGGAERIALQLHLDLQEKEMDMHLVGLEPCQTDRLNHATSLGLDSPYDLRAIFRLAKYLKHQLRPGDIVHGHLFPTSFYLAILIRIGLIKNPCLFTEHSTYNRRRKYRIFKVLDKQIYSTFSEIAAISLGTKNALTEYLPKTHSKVQTVFNGSVLKFKDFPERLSSSEKFTIISVGRLTAAKNYDTLLHALSDLTHVPFECRIFGEGDQRQRLESLSEELGLAHCIRFMGYITDLTPHLRAADMFVTPSKWEGFGLAVVEAMNAGLPVIASDIPGLREVTGPNGKSACLVPPNDANALRNAIIRMYELPLERQRLAAEGFKRSKNFSNNKMAEAYLKLYTDTVSAYNE